MHRQFAANVAFDDGRSVTETIQILQEQVTQVLDGFNSEF